MSSTSDDHLPSTSLFRAFAKQSALQGEIKVDRTVLLDCFLASGILEDDPRGGALFKAIRAAGEQIDFEQFQTLQNVSPALFEQVLTGQLAIPRFAEFRQELQVIFDRVANNRCV